MADCQKLVSIITPCYNAAAFIGSTIESVLKQTYPHWEMLIVDDCSTDSSADIIKSFADKDCRIRYFTTDKSSGSPSLPRNIGLDNSKGEFIAFLDADDLWLQDKLQQQVDFIEGYNHDFVYSDYEKMNYEGERNDRIVKMPLKSSFWDVIESCSIPCLTAFIRRKIIGSIRFRSIPKEDFAFWLDILKRDVIAYNTGQVTALYREQRQSRSSNKWKMISQQWFVLRNVQGMKSMVALYCMSVFLVKGFFKFLK